ncbi:hypothetical protein C5B94_03870 [Clavibacter michiganensis]|uniref:hypothetical protein n=1 Tax=Clavibacter michiganensis TaxID=28447 RepID=UPI000CE7FC83|nr:hypothetical protein [Clavibacter michiganensis]PPF56067.1 hypothetical protein C5B94_03870 [Clavibacter michiganensis]
MAIVNVKNAKIIRLHGKGFTVEEKRTTGGVEYRGFYAVWPQEGHTLTVGATINVSGFLSAKVARDPKYVDLSINSPRIEVVDAGEVSQDPSWDSAPPADPWGSQEPSFNAESPF